MAEAGTGGPPLISELYRCINVFPPCQRKTRDRGATPYFKTASAYQGRSTLHGRRTRDRGAAPYFIPALADQNSSAPCRQRSRDRGASPYFSTAIQVRVKEARCRIGQEKRGGGKSDMGGTAHV